MRPYGGSDSRSQISALGGSEEGAHRATAEVRLVRPGPDSRDLGRAGGSDYLPEFPQMNDIFLAAILWVLIKIWGAVEPSRASMPRFPARSSAGTRGFLMGAAIAHISRSATNADGMIPEILALFHRRGILMTERGGSAGKQEGEAFTSLPKVRRIRMLIRFREAASPAFLTVGLYCGKSSCPRG